MQYVAVNNFLFLFFLCSGFIYLAFSTQNDLKINLILLGKKTNSFFPFSLFRSSQIPYQPKNNQSKSVENSLQPLPDFARNSSSALREKGMPQ